ncbi:MAG TPA: putative manganese-dependent inorganic diphosphatase [Spirochaetota bacterium]|nr:putative manganese-dependent inorganic diphosphatase [Spirochaetota bacterium]
MKKIYVIGHKNPDMDSIVSAIAYAELKKAAGETNIVPARAGKINIQTAYILDRFGIPHPEFLSDIIPRVKNHMSGEPVTISHDTPLWEAMQVLTSNRFRMLPVVDENNKYLSSLHFNAFAQNLLKKIDPQKNSIISTSAAHLIRTLRAEPVVERNMNELFSAQVIAAASEVETLSGFIDIMPADNSIVIVGDRLDIQEYVIKKKIRLLVVAAGTIITKEIKRLAEDNNVTVLMTPFHTASASWLALHSTPVRYAGDTTLKPLNADDYIKNISGKFSDSVSKSLPVVDDRMNVAGVLTHGDLMKEPNTGLILVDHNELTQAVEGAKHVKILEIIDHHRLGNPATTYPITFINRPVGSTSTIIAGLYRDHRIPVRKEIAAILLAGILSDTLILRSATTTQSDIDTAEYLSHITGLTVEQFGADMVAAASVISSKPVEEIVSMDMKEYNEAGCKFCVSQVEVNDPDEIMNRSEEILRHLEELAHQHGMLFSSLLVTDLNRLSSYFFVRGSEDFSGRIEYPKQADGIYFLKDVLSRKKQLMPYISDIIKML